MPFVFMDRPLATILLLALFVAAGCASNPEREKPEQGPDEVVAGPPGRDAPAGASSGGLDAQVQGADRGEVVELRFGFSPDDDARVLLSTKEPGESRMTRSMRYRMAIEEAEDGLRVATRDLELLAPDDSESSREMAAYANEAYADDIGKTAYAVIVDEQAGIVRTEGVQRATRALQRMLTPDEYQGIPEAGRIMRAYMKASNVDKMAEVNWIFMVQVWNGQTLEIGQKKTAHFQGYFPTASQGYHPATINIEYMAVGKVACSERDSGRSCVRLRLLAVPRPEEMTLGVRRFMATMVSAIPKEHRPPTPKIDSFSSRMNVDVIVEPDTLLPHRFLVTHEDRLVLPNGRVSVTERKRETVYTY